VGIEPSDDELHAFVASMLSNLDRRLRDSAVIDEAIREHREMWAMLYRASSGSGPATPRSGGRAMDPSSGASGGEHVS
jgi:hypothetical protein